MKEYIDKDKLIGDLLDRKYSTAESKIEYGEVIYLIQKQPTAEVQEVVRCKDCVYWQGKKVKTENDSLKDYTPEEMIKGGMVDMSKGINLGSRCLRNQSWEENSFPIWCNENDFCSYGAKMDKEESE